MRDVVDFEGDLDVGPVRARGLGCAVYTGRAKPSDGWLAANADLVDWWIQETYSSRSAEVPSQGAADCAWAESVARRYPTTGQRIATAVSDGNGSDAWNAETYGVDWSNAATLPFFPYGDTAICASFIAGALRGAGAHLLVAGTDGRPGTWVPDSWGGGTVASQVANSPSPIDNADLDHVYVDFSTTPAPAPEDDDVPNLVRVQMLDGVHHGLLTPAGIMPFTGAPDPGAFNLPADMVAFQRDNPTTPPEMVLPVAAWNRLRAAWDGPAAGAPTTSPLPPTNAELVDMVNSRIKVGAITLSLAT